MEIKQSILQRATNRKILEGNGYVPHPKQQLLVDDQHRYKVIRCGRRFGKSVFAVNKIISSAISSIGDYWFVAPTYRQAKEIAWRLFDKYTPREFISKKNETELSIEFRNGSRISLKGADNPDSLRGVGLDGVVLDEYAFMSPYAWSVISPVLQDRKGWAIFISTPDGYNHFYELYNTKDDDFASFHFTSYDNPYLDPEELEKEKQRMSPEKFAQEYEAEFMKRSGAVWRLFSRDIHVVPQANPDRQSSIYGSIDFGFAIGHPTAFLLHEIKSTGEIFTFDGFTQEGLAPQAVVDQIKARSGGLTIRGIYCDTARPDLVSMLSQAGLPAIDAKKDVELGISKVEEYMLVDPAQHRPKWTISSHLTQAIEQIEQYVWQEVRGEDGAYKQVPKKENDDNCFAAGTKILTDKGQINIEELDTTYKVWTPFGWSKITSTGETGEQSVVDLFGTSATPNHKILTKRGFVPLDTLRYFDTIYLCEKPYTLKEYHIGDTQIRNAWNIGDILSHLLIRSLEARQNSFTEQSGKVSTEQYPKIARYIILTETLLTTVSRIWLVSLISNTANIIRAIGDLLWNKRGKQLRYGISPKRAESGTRNTERRLGVIARFISRIAKPVSVSSRRHSRLEQDSVDSTVKCLRFEEEGVYRRLNLPRKQKRAKVYNLSTETGCYFADGFLVSNCDALRYFLYSYTLPTKQRKRIIGYQGRDPVTGYGGTPVYE